MREKTIEQKLVRMVGQLGGICPKLTCPGFDGMPDRLVLMPGGRMAFVEVKSPGRGLRPLQAARQRLLTQLGYKVYVLDNPGDIARVLDETGGKDEHEQG